MQGRGSHMSSLMTTIGLGVRESIPEQFDKKSRVLEEERGVWNSQEKGKDKLSHHFSSSADAKNGFFFFKPGTDYTTVAFKTLY